MNKIMPKVMWMTLNSGCNFRCLWCYAKNTKYVEKNMPLDMAIKLLELAVDLKLSSVFYIGGEPSIYPNLFTLNDYARTLGIQTILVTNGLKFADDIFWQEYQKHPNDNIGFSIKSGNAKQHKTLTRTDTFLNTKKALQRICSSSYKKDVSITHNIFYLDNFIEIVKMIRDCGAEKLLVGFCGPTFEKDKISKHFMIPPKVLAENVMKKYEEACSIMDGKILYSMEIPLCLFPLSFIQKMIADKTFESVCHVHKSIGIIFSPDGKLQICNHTADFPIGQFGVDFHNADELIAYQNTPKISSYYNGMRAYPSFKCKNCTAWKMCHGGCPLHWSVYDPEGLVTPFSQEVKNGNVVVVDPSDGGNS